MSGPEIGHWGGEGGGGRHRMVFWTSLCGASACASASASRHVGAGGGRQAGLIEGAATLRRGGRNHDGAQHHGRNSVRAVVPGGRKGGAFGCGGARATSQREAGGGRQDRTLRGPAFRRLVAVRDRYLCTKVQVEALACVLALPL